jgi:hypothetical protein
MFNHGRHAQFPKSTARLTGIFPDFAGKTFKLGIVINAIWEFFRNKLQVKEKPDHECGPVSLFDGDLIALRTRGGIGES